MATLISSNGYSANDIASITCAFAYASQKQGRFCQELMNYLNQHRNWAPYKYIIVQQYQFEEDFAINGISAQCIWSFGGKFYSFIWLIWSTSFIYSKDKRKANPTIITLSWAKLSWSTSVKYHPFIPYDNSSLSNSLLKNVFNKIASDIKKPIISGTNFYSIYE